MASEPNDLRNADSVLLPITKANGCPSHRQALLGAMEKLEQAALCATNDAERDSYSVATILCAHGVAEAVLNASAQTHAPATYEDIAGRHSSLLRLAEEVLPQVGVCLSEDLIDLVNAKNALCDPNPATATLAWSWQLSAQRAAAAARSLHDECFPAIQKSG